jgi:hypothetical protein
VRTALWGNGFSIFGHREWVLRAGFVAQIVLKSDFPIRQTNSTYSDRFGYTKSGISGEDCSAKLDIRDPAIKVSGGYARPMQFLPMHPLTSSRCLQRLGGTAYAAVTDVQADLFQFLSHIRTATTAQAEAILFFDVRQRYQIR